MAEERNLSALAHQVRGVMDGRKVELRLVGRPTVTGRIVRIDEDEVRKQAAVASNGKLSHLLVVVDHSLKGDAIELDRILEIRPTLQ